MDARLWTADAAANFGEAGKAGTARSTARQLSVVTATVHRLRPRLLRLQVCLMPGIPKTEFSAFLEGGLDDARRRLAVALKIAGFRYPGKRVFIGQDLGEAIAYQPHFDLALALAILRLSGQLPAWGEARAVAALRLDGSLAPAALSTAALVTLAVGEGGAPARADGTVLGGSLICAEGDAAFARARGFRVRALKTLRELRIPPADLGEAAGAAARPEPEARATGPAPEPDSRPEHLHLADLAGQQGLRRALCIAAVGRHSLCVLGAPGSGKSELLRCMPYLMGPYSEAQWLELFPLYCAARAAEELRLRALPPVRTLYPTMNARALLGDGKERAGEWALSRYGVLLFEELTRMSGRQLSLIQACIDEERVHAENEGRSSREQGRILLASANPCPCGRYLEDDRSCRCTLPEIRRQLGRLHAAFRERFELWLALRAPLGGERRRSLSRDGAEIWREMRRQVERARRAERARAPGDALRAGPRAAAYAEATAVRLRLSLRQYRQLLDIARSIAELDGAEEIGPAALAEAAQYLSASFKL